MEVDGLEKEVLEEIAKRLVMSKEEIFRLVENRAELSVLESVLKTLEEKGFLAKVSPLGSCSYVVTTKGIKAIK
jgi:ribosomal protein S25